MFLVFDHRGIKSDFLNFLKKNFIKENAIVLYHLGTPLTLGSTMMTVKETILHLLKNVINVRNFVDFYQHPYQHVLKQTPIRIYNLIKFYSFGWSVGFLITWTNAKNTTG